MLNPFDPKASLLAKHAQHVVLIHFPIALYLTATFLDSLSRIFKKLSAFDAVRWNFLCAAIASLLTPSMKSRRLISPWMNWVYSSTASGGSLGFCSSIWRTPLFLLLSLVVAGERLKDAKNITPATPSS